jgi:LuxR family maltose regulon positive regulatory protein
MVVPHALQLLVPAKLSAPQPLAAWVRRERLLAQLGPAPECRLTLVVAPAGFGKSTLVAQWLAALAARHSPPKAAWLTLDEHDQDPLRFLAYLAAAVEQAAPGAAAATLGLLAAHAPPPAHVVLQALLVDLSALPGGLTLVLDDYDQVAAEPLHHAVAYLLRQLPPACRLVIISRADPPLSLGRLRAERQLRELRAADLRFTEGETGALLASLGGAADTDLAALLHRQTEGWALALQLAALAQLDAPASERGQAAATRQIAEYLAGEVVARQDAATVETLLALAVPERFCAGLCAALLGVPDELLAAESRLERLARANLFLAPLDEERRWFRFHHLFRDLLLRRLHLERGEGAVRELHLRAARWLADEGAIEEAVRHFLAAGDEDAAAALVEGLLLPEFGGEVAASPPAQWLRLLPAELVARRPGLALIVARMAVFSMDMAGFAQGLARVEALLAEPHAASNAPPWSAFAADLAALRGFLCYWRGQPAETIRHARAALAQGPTAALAVQALLQLGLAHVGAGAYAKGVALIEAGPPEIAARPGVQDALVRHSCLAAMHQLAGELDAQARAARRLFDEVAARAAGDLWVGYAASFLGQAAYERSDLAVAAEHFGALARRKYKVSYPGYMTGVAGLCLVALAQGELDEAAARAQQAAAFADEVGGEYLRNQALGLAARVALARGEVGAALRAAAPIRTDMHLGLSLALEAPRLTLARALIASGDGARLAEAETLLAACLGEVEPLHHTRLLIRVLATRALLREAQGRPEQAAGDLRHAVGLAAPRGFVRALLDLGPPVLPPLRRLAREGLAPAYLAGLLTAAPPQPGAPEPPELLTPRESEILGLLAQRWTDKEIAERLVIAPNTVRKHTSTLYHKLGVGDRREAVAAAVALGLLDEADR